VEVSNCGARSGGSCPTPPLSTVRTATPTIAWPAFPGAYRYAVRVAGSVAAFPLNPTYRLPALPLRSHVRIYVYAYTRSQPAGVAIGTALLRRLPAA
jgi:hypothetical protein